MVDPLEIIRAKRAEYQAELDKLEAERMGFIGAIAACDDLIKTLSENVDNANQIPG